MFRFAALCCLAAGCCSQQIRRPLYTITVFNEAGFCQTYHHCRLVNENDEGLLRFRRDNGKMVEAGMFYVCEQE